MDAQTQLVAELYKTLIPLLRKIKIASHEKGSMSQPTKARHGATTNHHREAGIGIIPTSRQENKEEI